MERGFRWPPLALFIFFRKCKEGVAIEPLPQLVQWDLLFKRKLILIHWRGFPLKEITQYRNIRKHKMQHGLTTQAVKGFEETEPIQLPQPLSLQA